MPIRAPASAVRGSFCCATPFPLPTITNDSFQGKRGLVCGSHPCLLPPEMETQLGRPGARVSSQHQEDGDGSPVVLCGPPTAHPSAWHSARAQYWVAARRLRAALPGPSALRSLLLLWLQPAAPGMPGERGGTCRHSHTALARACPSGGREGGEGLTKKYPPSCPTGQRARSTVNGGPRRKKKNTGINL